MVSSRSAQVLALIAVACASSCSDSTGPEGDGRTLGILQFSASVPALTPWTSGGEPGEPSGEPPVRWSVPPGDFDTPPQVLDAPLFVATGVPFDVAVYTVGPNGCWSADGLEVETTDRVVELTPWDRHSGADACTLIFGYLGHPASLSLAEPGVWTLMVRGRRVRGDGTLDDSVTAERTVVVSEDPNADDITLAIGEEATVDGVFRVAVSDVAEDSRCPLDVVCVWEGNAGVVVGLTMGTGPTQPFTLNTSVEPQSAEHGPYRVTLIGVLPAPVSTTTIPADGYRIRLLVERLP